VKKNNITNFKILDLKKLNHKQKDIFLEQIRICYNYYVEKDLFFTKNVVDKKSHKRWYKNFTTKKFDKILIALSLNNKFLGYVRSRKYYNYFFISVAISNTKQNKNIATKLLSNLILKTKFKSPKFFAIVKKKNIKSFNFFIKNNFKKTDVNLKILKKGYKVDNHYLIYDTQF
jgi:L-amino acid N-acyltransferase YncA